MIQIVGNETFILTKTQRDIKQKPTGEDVISELKTTCMCFGCYYRFFVFLINLGSTQCLLIIKVRKVYVYVYPSISEWLKLIQLLNEDCNVCMRTACMAWTACSTYVHRLCLCPTRWVHTDTLWQRCPVARSRRCRWIHRWLRSCLCHCHTSCNRCPEEREGCSAALFTKRDSKILEN